MNGTATFYSAGTCMGDDVCEACGKHIASSTYYNGRYLCSSCVPQTSVASDPMTEIVGQYKKKHKCQFCDGTGEVYR